VGAAEDKIKYHSERALAELDLALGTNCAMAARAHFALSGLHLERLRDLSEGQTRALQPVS
jgi:hypothetical protein